jgi:hypothetical protein
MSDPEPVEAPLPDNKSSLSPAPVKGGKRRSKRARKSGRRRAGRGGHSAFKEWVAFVKRVQKEEKLASYKEAMLRAKERKDKGEKWQKGGAPQDHPAPSAKDASPAPSPAADPAPAPSPSPAADADASHTGGGKKRRRSRRRRGRRPKRIASISVRRKSRSSRASRRKSVSVAASKSSKRSSKSSGGIGAKLGLW